MVEYTYQQLALFGYYDTYIANKANPVDDITVEELMNEVKDIDNFIPLFN